ncbi:MAG: TetR/AcrR family transcriptional regulator [Pseudonocardia sp.]
MATREIPLAGEPPPRRERADAARNRAQVLAAAEALLRERDPADVTMEDVVRAAGVGRATLYRRFPDVRSIAVALLDDHERDLQQRLLDGPPPLGPGAPPAQRLAAFYRAMVDLLERCGHLLRATESGAARFTTGAYGFWTAHVRALLAEAGAPQPGELSEIALAPLAPELYRHQRERLSPAAIADRLVWLAHRLAAP